ncbi:glycoside hydrolase family 18 protein [Acidobacterium sp. S8]|uniref:glycoside hydrolase family 18 protein n=1 Tax=Acidobacterium sp. S8 TaxID=1641854 RepID=UPI0020B11436|nr:glycoside hydrolase family 18 protein [Acidobacterium sp. S8]
MKLQNVRNRFLRCLALACVTGICVYAATVNVWAQSQVIAYVFPQHQLIQPGDIAARKLTRINYAFANLQGGKIINGFAEDDRNIPALVALKKENPSLKVLVSVGGWLWSGNFSDMALTKQSRELFIDSVVAFIDKYQLDGLDIDWEYPGMVGAGNHFRPEDKQNYTQLLKELRKRFNHEEKTLHHSLLLSVAAGASTEFLDHTEMGEVQKYLDSVNLMAYDYYEPDSDTTTGHHAPLYTNPSDPKKISADQSVREYEKAGVPPAKIVLGVPFYGHVWGQVQDVNHGLYQPGKPVTNAFASYGNITATMLNHGYERYWDAAASAPYLYSAGQKIFVSYEDPESLRLKSSYVLGHQLGGIMFWDYSGDPSGALLDTIDQGLHVNTSSQGGMR